MIDKYKHSQIYTTKIILNETPEGLLIKWDFAIQ